MFVKVMVRKGIQMFSFVWFLVEKNRGKFYIDPHKSLSGKMGILSICTAVFRIRIGFWFQCGSGSSISGQCGSGSGILIQCVMTKNLKKCTAEKKLIRYIFCLSKVAIYMYLSFHKGRLSYRRSLQPSKENIQHFKTWNFFFFLFLSVIFALLDPDPKHWIVQYLNIPLRQHKLERVNLLFFMVAAPYLLKTSVLPTKKGHSHSLQINLSSKKSIFHCHPVKNKYWLFLGSSLLPRGWMDGGWGWGGLIPNPRET
jgi:hypothetical protein